MKNKLLLAGVALALGAAGIYFLRRGVGGALVRNDAAGPRLPGMPAMPSMPSMPGMPTMPSMGNMPNAPQIRAGTGLPSVEQSLFSGMWG